MRPSGARRRNHQDESGCLVQARTRESVHNSALQLTETLSRALSREFDQALQWSAENNRADAGSHVKARHLAILCGSGRRFALRHHVAELKNSFHAGSIALLAPDIVDAIPGGRQPASMTLAVLLRPFAVGWREQTEVLL